MQKWEYMKMEVSGVIDSSIKDKDMKTMNRLGENGWEAFSTYVGDSGSPGTILFRRPLPKAGTSEPTSPTNPWEQLL